MLVRLCDQLDQHFPLQRLRGTLTAASRSEEDAAFERATVAFCRELSAHLHQYPVVLMLDSAELCTDQLLNWLGRQVIAPLAQASGNLALMLGSRGARVRESHWPAKLKEQVKSFRLDPLDFEATALHIQELPGGLSHGRTTEDIYDLSIGHPYSTEMLISWLREMGTPIGGPEETTQEDLARLLQKEVIRHYILAQAEEWVQPLLEVASIPRWFDPALLGKLVARFRPQVGGVQPIQFYVARISDLIDLHLVDMTSGGIGYHEEPTLRQLLNAVLTVLEPEEMTKMHGHAIEARRAALQPGADYAASYTLEILYHLSQKTLIEAPETLGEVLPDQLDALLHDHFTAIGAPDVVQASQLRHRLHNDEELRALVPRIVLDRLVARMDRFLHPPTPRKTTTKPETTGGRVPSRSAAQYTLNYVVLEHFPPTEYRCSWYRSGRAAIPVETVRTGVRFPLSEWRKDPERTGRAAYRSYLPTRAQGYIQKQEGIAIQLQTDFANIPWELLHDGREFLCIRWPMARQPKLLREPREPVVEEEEEEDEIRALVIGDPTGDLREARAEAKAVAELLQEKDVKVDIYLGDEATPELFSKKVATVTYDLLHFAGHGHFDEDEPKKSGLVLAQRRLVYGEELERVLSGQPFVFLSACHAGAGRTQGSKTGFWGKYTEGVAISALLAGAIGCLGPMWGIEDGMAKNFALEFYKRLLDQTSIGEAVRKARMWAKKQGDPDFWAAWILCGDPLNEWPVSV